MGSIKELKKKIDYWYNEFYIEKCLKDVVSVFEYKFISPQDIKIPGIIKRHDSSWFWKNRLGDPFLEASLDNRKLLGKDILKNGMYWPFVVHPNYDFIGTGHRVFALQLLNDKNKYLTIIDKNTGEKFTPRYIEFPKEFINNMYIKRSYDSMVESGLIQELEEDHLILLKVTNSMEYLLRLGNIGSFIRDWLYEYRELTGEAIQGSKVINDENYFNEWVK